MLKEVVTITNTYLCDDKDSLKMCVGMQFSEVRVSYKDFIIVSLCFAGDKVNYTSNVKFKDFALAMQTIECAAKHLNKKVIVAESSSEIVNRFVFEDNLFFAVMALQE